MLYCIKERNHSKDVVMMNSGKFLENISPYVFGIAGLAFFCLYDEHGVDVVWGHTICPQFFSDNTTFDCWSGRMRASASGYFGT